ncbi:type I restriction endonuclease [Rubritalea spongiae]|uniref:type I site-specific deoxyribonuclease n=1 Tax=Rubritalea spongiae TaxID=430797 RepID=A0ABW5E7L8_9BACT
MPQSEQTLENTLVEQLISLGYENADVVDEASLLANLKAQLEAFNGVILTESEFGKVMNHLTRSNAVFEKAKVLRDKMALERDCVRPDGSASQSSDTTYLDFLDDTDLQRNRFQVTQQVTMEDSYKIRYDVTV